MEIKMKKQRDNFRQVVRTRQSVVLLEQCLKFLFQEAGNQMDP